MTESDLLAERFEMYRDRLRAVALRMLGSSYEADDAVQETWLRLSRSDAEVVDNLGGWLTTVVARVCLDMLRARTRTERDSAEIIAETDPAPSPEEEALLADSVGLALLVVLDTLEPAERLAFVPHDMFAVPFDEIAVVVGRTPVAARQLASRARRRVQSDPAVPPTRGGSRLPHRRRHGDFAGLVRLLDPDVVVRADAVAVEMATARASSGAPALSREMYGVDAVTRVFAGGAKAARLMMVDGLAGAVVSAGGQTMAIFDFTLRDGRVVGIELISDPEVLSEFRLEPVQR